MYTDLKLKKDHWLLAHNEYEELLFYMPVVEWVCKVISILEIRKIC